MIFNIGEHSNPNWYLPEFTYTGSYELIDQGKTNATQNWMVKFNTSGILTFTKRIEAVDLFVLGAGGAGANTGGKAVGGGGYFGTYEDVAVEKGTEYQIIIGTGGKSSGQAGGNSSAFGKTANGGKAAVAGAAYMATCEVYSVNGTAGNVYWYESLSANRESEGSGYVNVDLIYPYITEYHDNGNLLYRGNSGWYLCNINKVVQYYYRNGTNGTGGSTTYIFGDSSLGQVGGPGVTSGQATRLGQGGGSSVIAANNGLVMIRNPR